MLSRKPYRHPEPSAASSSPAAQAATPGTAHLGIPDIRILPAEALVLHEHADPKRVARLANRLRVDGFLKNPPIVAPIPGTERFVVLDGANRTSALMQLGTAHLLVQVVDYKTQVELLTWHHLVAGKSPEAFLQEITQVRGLVLYPTTIEQARQALDKRAILAYLSIPTNKAASSVYMIDGEPGTDHHGAEASTALLNAMVDTYKGDPQVTIYRVNSDELTDLSAYYDNVSGLVVFPSYTPDDILALAEAGTKVPTGITRHIISHRALRVNVPLAILESDQLLSEKNAWWRDQLKSKLATNQIRLYQESTYLFDE